MENLDLSRAPLPRIRRLARRLAAGIPIAYAVLALACGPHEDEDPPTLGERLAGNWYCERSYPDQGFLRTDRASMDVYRTTLHLNFGVSWSCDSVGPCPGEPPDTYGSYFEGVFRDLGDSLALQDAADTVAFRNVTDSGLTLVINGRLTFPLRRR
jgi:hypothetical protein